MATNFYLESVSKADRNGDVPIRISVSLGGVRFVTSSGMKINPSKWDSERQQVKRNGMNGSGVMGATINARLLEVRKAVEEIKARALFDGEKLSAATIKDVVLLSLGRNSKSSDVAAPSVFTALVRFFLEESSARAWTHSTLILYKTLETVLKDWRKDLKFSDFTLSGLNDFVKHMRTVRGVRDSTLLKHLTRLRTFLSWASRQGYDVGTAYKDFRPAVHSVSNDVVFLTWDELMRVFRCEIPASGSSVRLTDYTGKEYIKIVEDASGIASARDIFCFCAFTSLRYSDSQNLRTEHISGESDSMVVKITTQKTGVRLTIQLNKYARAVLDRQKKTSDGYALPRLSNQRMNIYLKDLAELCEINTPVTLTYYRGSERIDKTLPKFKAIGTHTARRTFICNALSLGIPAEVVMKWTGHADYASMKPYIDVADETKAKEMSKFDSL